jgi:hypothetical protein
MRQVQAIQTSPGFTPPESLRRGDALRRPRSAAWDVEGGRGGPSPLLLRSLCQLARPPVRLGRAARRSPYQFGHGTVTAREARRIVKHCDSDCSDENRNAQHQGDYDGVAPVASASAPILIALVQRSTPLRPRTGNRPPCPLVLGSDGVIWGTAVTRGEFLCSVKAITAITMTIAATVPIRAPLPHSPPRSLWFGIASSPFSMMSCVN